MIAARIRATFAREGDTPMPETDARSWQSQMADLTAGRIRAETEAVIAARTIAIAARLEAARWPPFADIRPQ